MDTKRDRKRKRERRAGANERENQCRPESIINFSTTKSDREIKLRSVSSIGFSIID
jgi:hypothetical protein